MTADRLEVSIVIPTLNRRRLLGMTLQSVLAQRGVDFEVIVVDDGSTDDTLQFLDGLRDERLRVIRNERAGGVSRARNRGIAAARGQWIAFCDDDDLWAPDKLSSQLAAASEADRLWVYTGSVNVNARNQVVAGVPPLPPDEVLARLGEINVIPGGCSGVVVDRALLRRTGGFDDGLSPMADWDLWLRLRRHGPPALAARPLVAYRVHDANISLDRERMEVEFEEMKRRHPTADWGIFYRYLGWWCLRVGRRREAVRLFLKAAHARSPRYGWHEIAADFAYVCRSLAESKGIHLPVGGSQGARSPEDDEWRMEGARWIGTFIDHMAENRPHEDQRELRER
jgi:glycosyltransferase involved in cell wall biosynthesis